MKQQKCARCNKKTTGYIGGIPYCTDCFERMKYKLGALRRSRELEEKRKNNNNI